MVVSAFEKAKTGDTNLVRLFGSIHPSVIENERRFDIIKKIKYCTVCEVLFNEEECWICGESD